MDPSLCKTKLLTARSSAEWIIYYRKNAEALLNIPWKRGPEVTPEEVSAIASSLRAWQLGETSDGRHLTKAALQYSRLTGDLHFADAVRLFIKEEQRHGENLGRFLDLAGIGRSKKNWGDSAFRAIRYALPVMELWVTPVIMVETHALIYYRAIKNATRSKLLRTLCTQILRDEVKHIRFQYERLAILHRDRSLLFRELTMLLHRAMFVGVTLSVWIGHRKALRAGGLNFRTFWKAVWKKMNFAWSRANPELYNWSSLLVREQPQLSAQRADIFKKVS